MKRPTRYGVAVDKSEGRREWRDSCMALRSQTATFPFCNVTSPRATIQGSAAMKGLSTILVAAATLIGVITAASLTSTGLVFAEPQVASR
jgi:hypothetical protein